MFFEPEEFNASLIAQASELHTVLWLSIYTENIC